ncbi:hypothetical protein [Fortiea contorta]|uniref:hypothetical protein n=1 Tax=Fortiea contorta TaxID=1892405 RepID=UPI000344CC7C|nr:hypothetical protein [Fortiea contorta]
MGRWTPLILMAGGLAILLGTLLGINFPMGGQSASVPNGGKTSKVLPANINVNSTAAGRNNRSGDENRSVAQNNTSIREDSIPDSENSADANSTESQSLNAQAGDSQSPANEAGSAENQPIRALW